MTRKYMAADFANAKFAEHEDTGALAVHRVASEWEHDYEWTVLDDDGYYGHIYPSDLVKAGWVPVPTKPTLSDSEVGDIAKNQSDDWLDGFITGYQHAGGTILDETPKERATRLVNEVMKSWGWGDTATATAITDRLIETGLVKDN